MGRIRGSHTSPGIYTRFTDNKKNIRSRNRGYSLKANNSGGGVVPPIIKEWVFGNMLPITFS